MLDKLEIEKITHALPFRLDHVHTFLGEGEEGYRIIDTGLTTNETASLWLEKLEGKTLEAIILSHLHPDHTDYAGALQEAYNAEVWMTARDAHDLKNIWTEEGKTQLVNTLTQADVPEKIIDNIASISERAANRNVTQATVTHHLKEGDKIKLGKYDYEVFEVPGHSAGLICFYQKDMDVLLSTDHILPEITPNIAYWFYGEKNPLQSYENSLNKIKQLNAGYVIPSHRAPFENANKRIDEIWQHHEDRLSIVLEVTKEPVTIYTVCQHLFQRELKDYDYQFAVGETIAHLVYLEEKGLIQRGGELGKVIFYQKPQGY